MQADPVGLDPHVTQATSTRNQLENVYDTLVAFDPSGKIVPSLATRWTTSKDGLTWTFTLRSDVKFHNGRAFEASDVVYSINRIKDPATKSPTQRGLRADQERDGAEQDHRRHHPQQAVLAAAEQAGLHA